MSKDAEGTMSPEPGWTDAAPEGLRFVYTQLIELDRREEVRNLFMALASDPTLPHMHVPGFDGVVITQEWVNWYAGFRRHAQFGLDAMEMSELADQYLRRRSRAHRKQQPPPDRPPTP